MSVIRHGNAARLSLPPADVYGCLVITLLHGAIARNDTGRHACEHYKAKLRNGADNHFLQLLVRL
jgi:hypothetical protein